MQNPTLARIFIIEIIEKKTYDSPGYALTQLYCYSPGLPFGLVG